MGFARLITGSSAGGFLLAALLPLRWMAQKSPAPQRRSSDCKARVRKDTPETVESWTVKFFPQSEFVLSLLKCCSQYEGPGMTENLMATIKKGVEKVGGCFNRETPKH